MITLILALCGCKKPQNENNLSYFTNEMGREVFLMDDKSFNMENKTSFDIPEGYHFLKLINDDLYVAYTKQKLDGSNEEDEYIYRYGVFNHNGSVVVECKYESLFSTGNFLYGEYFTDEIEYKNDVMYIDGTLILTTDYVIELDAIGDDYCALYYENYSQVFDKDGIYYFKDANKMSGALHYSICDDYLFGYDINCGDWFIWQLFTSQSGEIPFGFTVLKKIFEGENSLHTVAYMGDYNFLVVETINSPSEYDYFEVINGTTYYLKQKTSIYNVQNDKQTYYKSSYPILSVVNHYSPTLTLEQRSNLNIKLGYSQVNAGVVDDNGERIAYRYYVLDNKGNFVIRYPENMNPTAMRFIDGYGFASGAGEGYTSALYYMNCDPYWIKNDREYYAQSFTCGRYVLSCSLADGIRYGILDSDGETVVDFEYAYISAFTNDLAFYRKTDGTVGIMDINGETVEVINNFVSGSNTTAFGIYEFEQEGKRGLKAFDGTLIAPPIYDSLTYIGKNNDKLIIVVSSASGETYYSFDK